VERSNDQMMVVGHLTRRPALDFVSLESPLQDRDESRIIEIIEEDGHLVVAAAHHMVDET
jgi:hypothetical protein